MITHIHNYSINELRARSILKSTVPFMTFIKLMKRLNIERLREQQLWSTSSTLDELATENFQSINMDSRV